MRPRATGLLRAAFVALGVGGLGGCPRPDAGQGLPSSGPVDGLLDYNQFVCAAQPVLIRRCSYLACHGQTTHALRLYSPGKLRQLDDGTRAGRDAPLTDSEVELNYESVSGLLYAAGALERTRLDLQALPLLAKPLRAAFGGAEHHGVGIFPVPPADSLADDAEWQALSRWVAGSKQPSPVDDRCRALFGLMGLRPR